ncbi:hypothetical protein MUO79_00700 [Candidatus Bathyarchaeota archaeon]|nr:hypothetical protein [Candidatus Bathyarchaeota archaeon]
MSVRFRRRRYNADAERLHFELAKLDVIRARYEVRESHRKAITDEAIRRRDSKRGYIV